ncbi:MAG TPA: hypothetical protein VJU18_02205 [Vicinamibacteria bacterium]|nr:hypothetical protein [Vicinamibacteria bacterium]
MGGIVAFTNPFADDNWGKGTEPHWSDYSILGLFRAEAEHLRLLRVLYASLLQAVRTPGEDRLFLVRGRPRPRDLVCLHLSNGRWPPKQEQVHVDGINPDADFWHFQIRHAPKLGFFGVMSTLGEGLLIHSYVVRSDDGLRFRVTQALPPVPSAPGERDTKNGHPGQ